MGLTQGTNTTDLTGFFHELETALLSLNPANRHRTLDGILLYARSGAAPDAETQRRILMQHFG